MSLMSKQEIIKSKNGYDIHCVITEPMDTEIHPCMILLHSLAMKHQSLQSLQFLKILSLCIPPM